MGGGKSLYVACGCPFFLGRRVPLYLHCLLKVGWDEVVCFSVGRPHTQSCVRKNESERVQLSLNSFSSFRKMTSQKLLFIIILLIVCLVWIIFQSYEIASLKLHLPPAIGYHLQMPTDVWSAYPQTDQSGAIILVMLKAHAYAYAKNLRFRGLCYDENQGQALPSPRRAKIHKQLAACLKRLNVPTVLNLSCPDEYIKNRTLIVDSSVDKRILNLNLYNSLQVFHQRVDFCHQISKVGTRPRP